MKSLLIDKTTTVGDLKKQLEDIPDDYTVDGIFTNLYAYKIDNKKDNELAFASIIGKCVFIAVFLLLLFYYIKS